MSLPRFEPVTIQSVARTVDANGGPVNTFTNLFSVHGRIRDVKNTLKLNELYRLYADWVNIQMNLTSNTLLIAEDQENYSLGWRGNNWRIVDAVEADDRQYVEFLCYFAKPGITV